MFELTFNQAKHIATIVSNELKHHKINVHRFTPDSLVNGGNIIEINLKSTTYDSIHIHVNIYSTGMISVFINDEKWECSGYEIINCMLVTDYLRSEGIEFIIPENQ